MVGRSKLRWSKTDPERPQVSGPGVKVRSQRSSFAQWRVTLAGHVAAGHALQDVAGRQGRKNGANLSSGLAARCQPEELQGTEGWELCSDLLGLRVDMLVKLLSCLRPEDEAPGVPRDTVNGLYRI